LKTLSEENVSLGTLEIRSLGGIDFLLVVQMPIAPRVSGKNKKTDLRYRRGRKTPFLNVLNDMIAIEDSIVPWKVSRIS
jgi:hypothetical protein